MAERAVRPRVKLVRPALIAAAIGSVSFWVSRGVLADRAPRGDREVPTAAPPSLPVELGSAVPVSGSAASPDPGAEDGAPRASDRSAPSRATPIEPSARYADLPRTDTNLFRQLFTEPTKLATRDLVRHVLLNPRDQLVSVADIEFLESIVASYREPLTLLAAEVEASQAREFDALIAAGKQPSATTKAGPDGKLRARVLFNSDAFVLRASGGQAVQFDASYGELPATRRALRSRTELAYQLGGTLIAYFASISALSASEAQARQGELMDLAAKYLNR